MTRSDVTVCSWNSPAGSDLWLPDNRDLNPVDYRIWGLSELMQEMCVLCTLYKTPVGNTSDSSGSLTRGVDKHVTKRHRQSSWSLWLRASTEVKGHHVEHLLKAAHIFVSPGDAPAIITQYVAWTKRQFNACQTHRSMYRSIFNSFRVIQCLSPNILVSAGAITLNVVWTEREFDAHKLSRSMCPSD